MKAIRGKKPVSGLRLAGVILVWTIVAIMLLMGSQEVGADGACCLPDGTCIMVHNHGDCFEGDGTYQGDDTVCGQVNCPTPLAVPTLNQWGAILFSLLVGLGALDD